MTAGNRGKAAKDGGALRTELVAEVMGRGSGLTFVTRGGSMSPFLRPGDRVTVEPLIAGPAELAVGDVAAFRDAASARVFVHRLLVRTPGGWLAQGDRNPAPDGVIDDRLVLGRVTAVERNGRRRFLPRGTLGILFARITRPLLELRLELRRHLS